MRAGSGKAYGFGSPPAPVATDGEAPERYDQVDVVTVAPVEFSADTIRTRSYGRFQRVSMPRHIAERFASPPHAEGEEPAPPQVILVEAIEWKGKQDPAEYLEKHPDGPQAAMARVLVAFPDLLPKGKPSGSKEPSGDSSGPSES